MSVTTDYWRAAFAEPTDHDLPIHDVRLILEFASGQKRAVRLPDGPCRIGGAPDSTVRVAGIGTHCVLFRGPRGVVVRNWSGEALINGRTFRESPLRYEDQLAVPGCVLRLEAEPHGPAVRDMLDFACRPRQPVVATPPTAPSQELRLSRPQAQRLLDQLQRAEQRQQWLEQQLSDRNGRVNRLRLELDQQRDQFLAERRADAEKHRGLLRQARRRVSRHKKRLTRELDRARGDWRREHEKIQRRLDRYRELVHRRRREAAERPADVEGSRQQQLEQRLAELEAQATELRGRAAVLVEREADLESRERDVEVRLADLQQQQQSLDEGCETLRCRTAEFSEASAEQIRQNQERSAALDRWETELQSQKTVLEDARAQLDRDQQQLLHHDNASAEASRQRLQDLDASLADAQAQIQQLTDQLSSVLAEKELIASELQTVKAQLASLTRSEQEARESLAAIQADLSRPLEPSTDESDAWEEERRRLQTDLHSSQQALEEAQQRMLAIQGELEQLRSDSRTAEASWAESREDWNQQRSVWQQENARWESLVEEQRGEIARLSDLESASRQELERVLADARSAAEVEEQFQEKASAFQTREQELTERLETLEQMQLRAENDRTGWEHESKQLASQYEQQLAELRAELDRLRESPEGIGTDDAAMEHDEFDEEEEQNATLLGLEFDLVSAPAGDDTHDDEPLSRSAGYQDPDTASILARYGFQEEEIDRPLDNDATGDPDGHPDDEAEVPCEVDASPESEEVEAGGKNPETICDSELQSILTQFRVALDEEAEEAATHEEARFDDVESSVDREDDSAEHDESIEAYMQRLLGRKWKETQSPHQESEVQAANVSEPPEVAANQVHEFPREKPSMPPKRFNPLMQKDLSAMRELANASTRDAIMKHAQSQRGWQVTMQLATSIMPFLSGVILVILGESLHKGLMYLGAALMLGSIGISVYQYQKWSGKKSTQRESQDAVDDAMSSNGEEEVGSEESN